MTCLRLLGLFGLFAVTGCAPIENFKLEQLELQSVSIQTFQDNMEMVGVGCTLANDAGKWFVTSPGSVTIQRSAANLVIDCRKANTGGHETIVSKPNKSVLGTISAGGIIGYAADSNSGIGFDYPSNITVTLHKY